MTSDKLWWEIVAVVIIISVIAWWDKPTCRAGFVPVYSLFSSWACVAGYKPE
jgi:hypothetical protein